MESIIINVDDTCGSMYNSFSPEYKMEFSKAVNLMLKKVINDHNLPGYKKMLDNIGREAEAKGLNSDILDQLLKDND